MTSAATQPGRAPSVLLVRGRLERSIARRLASDLRRRGFSVSEGEPCVERTLDPNLLWPDTVSVVVVPKNANAPRSLAHVERVVRMGLPAIVLADVDDRRPGHLGVEARDIIRYGEGADDHDRTFEGIFRSLLGPFPGWLDVRVAPSLVSAPTGVSWWSDDLFVADEDYGQVVRLGADPGEHGVVVSGLSQPHHIHLDRNKLLIANRGAHRLVVALVEDGSLKDITNLAGGAKDFTHPNGVHQGHGVTVVADTDNHAVHFTRDDPTLRKTVKPTWRTLKIDGGLRYPCGVHVHDSGIWIADTFNNRVVVVGLDGKEAKSFYGRGWASGFFAQPVGIAIDHNRLFVVDAEPRRVQVFGMTIDSEDAGPQLHGLGDRLGEPWIANPFGISVNQHGQMAISDRLRRCVWLIKLDQALAAGAAEFPEADEFP